MTGGNMYEWVGYTWNPLAGACPHDCEYCYVKDLARRFPNLRKKYTGPLRIDEKALNQKLPRDRIIFVCSMNDLFAEGVPDEYIERILRSIVEKQESWGEHFTQRFLFQTKNPRRMMDWIGYFPPGSTFATTIESNRNLIKTKAPEPKQRYVDFKEFKEAMMEENHSHLYEVTIEPILDFDVDILFDWLLDITPDFVSIGADSKHHHLPEPSEEKIVELVRLLQENGFYVHLKKNLKRIAPRVFEEVSR